MVIVALLKSPSRRNLWEEAKKLIAKGFEKITYERVQKAETEGGHKS